MKLNTEVWNSSKMGGTGGALKALTKNLANQLTLNRSEMKRVVARVISERHGQGDVGDYNGHMFFVKPERIDLTKQITHSKEAFDDMIQQKRMMYSTSRNHMFNTPSGSRSRTVNMTLQNPKPNKSLTGVIIDQKHLPKSGNLPEIVVQISKPRIAAKLPKRIPVTLSPRPIHIRASKRRLLLRKPRLPDAIKCTYCSGSKSKPKISHKKMLIRSHLAKIKKPLNRVNVLSVCRQPVKPLKQQQRQHQQQQRQQQHQQQQQQQQHHEQEEASEQQSKQESSHRLGAGGTSAGSKAVLAVEKAQSLVEELVSSSVALSQKKSQSLEQPMVKKQKSSPQKKKSGKLQSNKSAKSKINNGSKQKKLDGRHSNSNNKSNNNNYNSSNININNNNNYNYSCGFKNAGRRLQAGGIMAEACKLGINTPAVNRYSKYWRNPYLFPGGAGATQMYDTAKERYAVASARSKMLAKRKQAAAAVYTNFQREQQQSHMSLKRVRKNKSQAHILQQLKRNEAIDKPEILDTSISWRGFKRHRRPYKLSARMEELAKPTPYRSVSPEATVRGHSRSPVHRPKGLKQRLHRRRRQQQQQEHDLVLNSNTSLGSFAHLRRATSRSGLTPAKRHLTLAFLKKDGPSQRSLRHSRNPHQIFWR